MFRAGGVPRGSTEIEIPAVDLPADLSLQDEDHLSEEIKEKRLELAEKDALLLAERVLAALTYELAEKDSQLAEKDSQLAEKVTAAKIKEGMESRFRGKEEMLLMEFEIQKVLQRIYRRVSNGKQPCGANESDDEPESDNEEGHEEEV